MLKQKFENVTVISNKGEISNDILQLAQQLRRCRAQRALFKDWRMSFALASKCMKELINEYANTDPVENIIIYADDNTILVNQGAYFVWGNVNDVVIEEANLSWNKWGGRPIRVGFKPGAIITVQPRDGALCFTYDILVMRVREDGFCGDTILGKKKYGLHQTKIINKTILFRIKKQVEVEEE